MGLGLGVRVRVRPDGCASRSASSCTSALGSPCPPSAATCGAGRISALIMRGARLSSGGSRCDGTWLGLGLGLAFSV